MFFSSICNAKLYSALFSVATWLWSYNITFPVSLPFSYTVQCILVNPSCNSNNLNDILIVVFLLSC